MNRGSRLEVRGARKAYGDTQALDDLSMAAASGEITGIAGPNGAGKSTLVKALAGEISVDAGTIVFVDANGNSRIPRVAVVHQETSLFPTLTVAENLAIGRDPVGLSRPSTTESDRRILKNLGIDGQANRPINQCSLVVRQLTEIGRAFIKEDVDVLLLDEPNSALTVEESKILFDRVKVLRDQGQIILLVSHRLDDLVAHSDRVLIVRDGTVTVELSRELLTESAIARELVTGHPVSSSASKSKRVQGSDDHLAALKVSAWTHAQGRFHDVELTAKRDRITALVGNESAGARELLRSLGGFEKATGQIIFTDSEGRTAPWESEYMPAERQVSLFSNMNCSQNTVSRLSSPQIASRGGWLRREAMSRLGRDLMDRFLVRGGRPTSMIRELSGGNQQKVAIAAAIARDPRVLLLEEPTRGVDLGSKAEIYKLLKEFALAGHVVIAFCTEASEVFELADEVTIVAHGVATKTVNVDNFDAVTDLAHAMAEYAQGEVIA